MPVIVEADHVRAIDVVAVDLERDGDSVSVATTHGGYHPTQSEEHLGSLLLLPVLQLLLPPPPRYSITSEAREKRNEPAACGKERSVSTDSR